MMRKKNRLKLLSLALGALMCVQALGAGSLVAYAADGERSGTVSYTDSFDYDAFDTVWQAETKSSKNTYMDFADPDVRNGVICLTEGESAMLNWTKIPNIVVGSAKTYTITFDVKITDHGDDKALLSNRSTWKRELYVALGGWYDQLKFESGATNPLYAGETSGSDGYALNSQYSVTMVWNNSAGTVQSTVQNGDYTLTGTRSKTEYKGMEDLCSFWAFRCEDGACEISNFSFSDGTNTYAPTDISFAETSNMAENGLWSIESKEVPNAMIPVLSNGVLKMASYNSVKFDWTGVSGVGEYDPTNIYTFEFDFTVTDDGDGSEWGSGSGRTRALYVAPGGYYNQIEFPTKDNRVRAGDTYVTYDAATMENQGYHAQLVWEGTVISTTITDSEGRVLAKGSRSSASYADISERSAAMSYLVLRCEDGAVEIDNFSFSMQKNAKISSTDFEIPAGKQAVYFCSLIYAGTPATVKLGGSELFAISEEGVRFCGCSTNGSYGAGTYGVTVYVNPTQEMVLVEVTLPNGGTVRRGTYQALTDATSIDVYSGDINCVTGASVTYSDITVNDYTLNTTEPQYEGFGANVYNLVTSFTDARTDRAFAWTALESFIGSNAMALKYRVAGASEWTVVDAVKESETLEGGEDFFKADVTGLTAGTAYEYKIGVKGSDDEVNHWSKTYTFRTADQTVNGFSFIAVGDTQGKTWNGTTTSDKGFMFAQTAFNEAFETVQNPAFIFHAGDVVENQNTTEQWNMYFKTLGDYATATPHFAAIGNHDGNAAFDAHFNHPNNGGSAAVDTSMTGSVSSTVLNYLDETIYSYDYGNAHFIVLNTGKYAASDEYLIKAQREWLENDLKANADAKWTILMLHEPVYHRVGGSESRPWLYDTIESYGVDLVIQGHSHLVTRTYPMKNGEIVTKTSPDLITKGTGTVYTTIGSTAYNHDSLGNPNMEECMTVITPDNAQPAYTEVRVDGDRLVMTVRQANGLVLDTFTIEDRPEVVLEGFQTGAGSVANTADARFVASMKGDYRDYDSVGFELTYKGDMATVSCRYVYEGIMAAGELLTPDGFGADYFFCYTVGDLAEGEYTFGVRAWHVKKGSTSTVYSEQKTVTLVVAADGTVTRK